jgi:HAD superfamily hydrolase (TIGR01509 family)
VAIKNIIFDLGGVLLNLDFAGSRNAFIQLGIPQIDDLFSNTNEDSFWKLYEIGRLTDEEFLAEARKLAIDGTTEQDIIRAWNSMLLDFPRERVELLEKLRERYRLFLFSNTNSIHLQSFQESFREVYNRDLDSLFEKAWYSHLINRRKPNVEAFHYIIEEAGLHAPETLFIDDSPANVEGARRAGLHAHHLAPGTSILHLDLLTP